MKKLLLILFLLLGISSYAQDTEYLKFVSWNIQNIGKSKSDSTLYYIANKLKNYDIVAVQEVSTSEFGAQAIAKLDDQLDRTGSSWDYSISASTSGDGSERYAYLYKKSRVTLESTGLEKSLDTLINREPFRGVFLFNKKQYYIFTLHLVPTNKNPELEVEKLSIIPKNYKNKNIIICGDFNLSSSDKSYNGLRSTMVDVLKKTKTSLKMKPDQNGEVLNAEYDNFWVSNNTIHKEGQVLLFYKDFKTLSLARKVSDHCPIFLKIK